MVNVILLIVVSVVAISSIVGTLFAGRYYIRRVLEDHRSDTDDLVEMQDDKVRKRLETQMITTENLFRDYGGWLKDYHKLYLSHLSGVEKRRVYGFFLQHMTNGIERLVMSPGETYEEAYANMLPVLKSAGGDLSTWLVKANTFLDMPLPAVETVQRAAGLVEKTLGEPLEKKPVDIYINYLQFASDKFAGDPADKESIARVIKNIKTTYESKQSNRT